MGRPEGSGCYCFANDLLSECIIQLECDYRFIVIDTEAGMEHISRGTIWKAGFAADYKRSRCTGIAYNCAYTRDRNSVGLERKKFLLFSTGSNQERPVDFGDDIPIAIIPDDPRIEAADLAATPVSQIPVDSPARGCRVFHW